MGDCNEEVILTNVMVAQPTTADQNEWILQLMQQIAEIRVEMQRRQDLPSPGFAANATDGIPLTYFPSSNMDPAQNHPSAHAQNFSVIDLTTQQHAFASYQTPTPRQNNYP